MNEYHIKTERGLSTPMKGFCSTRSVIGHKWHSTAKDNDKKY
jgi:hypothetical protein